MGKQGDFELLRVKYGTHRSYETNHVIGTKRNGNIKYAVTSRTGMMTALGDIEIYEWIAKAKQLIDQYDEWGIYERLKSYAFPFMTKQQAEQYALELHMARIFENPEWVHYRDWQQHNIAS